MLVTVAAAPPHCEREARPRGRGEEARRSRELLARRALLVELDGDEVAGARPVLDDVEELLREVAALDPARAPTTLEAIQRQMERGSVLMKIDLMTRELHG